MLGLIGILIAIGGLYASSPWVTLLCGAVGAVCLIRAFMNGMSG